MALNNFNLGNDVSVVINTSLGPLQISPEFITSFDAQPQTETETRRGLIGKPMFELSPAGWSGSFKIDRSNSQVDDYFAALEGLYYAGQRQSSGSVIETIQEIDGSISQYEYRGAKFILEDLGSREATKRITMSVKFMASDRVKRA